MPDYKKYETMAKLDLPEAEHQYINDRMEKLLADFDEIAKINTDGTEPLFTVLDIQNVLRDDVAKKTISRDELLNAAPQQYDGYFRVPKTLD